MNVATGGLVRRAQFKQRLKRSHFRSKQQWHYSLQFKDLFTKGVNKATTLRLVPMLTGYAEQVYADWFSLFKIFRDEWFFYDPTRGDTSTCGKVVYRLAELLLFNERVVLGLDVLCLESAEHLPRYGRAVLGFESNLLWVLRSSFHPGRAVLGLH